MNNKGNAEPLLTALIVFGVIIFFVLCSWIGPSYHVWQQGMEGQAELSKADFSKKVAVQEAQAKMDAATLLANAEVERAKGVAKANEIIGQSLKANESYLRYLWITEVAGHDTNKTVVYVPTEANVPILESTRHIQ